MRRRVVFPDPEAPSRVVTEARSRARFTPSSSTRPSWAIRIWWASRAGAIAESAKLRTAVGRSVEASEAPMEPLLALLSRVVPADGKEEADLALMRAQAKLLAEPFSRRQPTAHFTGSAVVTDGRRVALVYHRKFSRWLQPGGHAEPEDGG